MRQPNVVALLQAAGLALGLGVAGPADPARAVVVRYEAIDLPDAGPLDLWRYRYQVSDAVFSKGQGFSVLFGVGAYEALGSPPPTVNADWDPIVIQPDPLLPDPGRYDAQARVDAPSLADPFEVGFAWLGAGTPGSQAFEIYDASFQTIETGETVPVPEPASALLVGVGLLGLSLRRRGGQLTSPSDWRRPRASGTGKEGIPQ